MQNTLVDHFKPFVIHVAKKYRDYGVPFDDLVQEGLIGLLEAGKRYDSSRAKFTTYAAFWIKNRIVRALDKERKDSLSAGELTDEAAGRLAAPPDAPRDIAGRFTADLPGLEGEVLRLVFEEQRTLSEAADKLGISRERVRQVKNKALRRLNTKLTKG